MQISIVNRPCALCGGGGLVRAMSLCPRCEGEGRVPRLVMAFPVVGAAEALAFDGPWWSRLVVTEMTLAAGKTLVRGVTDSGRSVTAFVRPRALDGARLALFEEKGFGA